MGTKAREILGMYADKLVELLNKALGDEWLAYYQYWIGAKVAKGPMRGEVTAELELHATEELGHALLLVNRIVQLGGTPLLTPEDWYKMTNCGYEAPEDPYVEVGVYKALSDLTKDVDPVTYEMALQIMADEIEHEEDLEALQEDIELMKARS